MQRVWVCSIGVNVSALFEHPKIPSQPIGHQILSHPRRTLITSPRLLGRKRSDRFELPQGRMTQPSFLEKYDTDRKDIPKRLPATKPSAATHQVDLSKMEFELEEEPLNENEKKLLEQHMQARKPKTRSFKAAVNAHVSSLDSKSLALQQLHEQRELRKETETDTTQPVPVVRDPQSILRQAEDRLATNRHESRLLQNGHRELTLKLKVLYHKLHCANMISLNILNKKDKSLVHIDRRIESLWRQLRRVQLIRRDNQRIVAQHAQTKNV
ncbi:hypothetical protein XU18_3519 [Perkinsela sp. CCAP 1560/4]|nr:hypothetical protein XU18_3519 [Perkinsela sp. CCAP 1560/4]|eukprot:KNH05548.1 hypothetical protein XU18_3519 [Perkinsela sp. CCAP 1560/4]